MAGAASISPRRPPAAAASLFASPSARRTAEVVDFASRVDHILGEESYEDVVAQQVVVEDRQLPDVDPMRGGPVVLRACGSFREGGGGDLGASPGGRPWNGQGGRLLGGRRPSCVRGDGLPKRGGGRRGGARPPDAPSAD